MADTERTTAELLALLADNTDGQISPQDARDVLVSVQGGFGGIQVSATAAAQGSIGTAFVVLTGWAGDTPSDGANVIPQFGSDRCIVTLAGKYLVHIGASFSGTANAVITMRVHALGVQKDLKFRRKINTGGDVASGDAETVLAFGAGDTVDVRVKADASGKTITLESAYLTISRQS